MKEYEYDVKYGIPAGESLTLFLNKMGKRGFRLVQVITKEYYEDCYIFECEDESFKDKD